MKVFIVACVLLSVVYAQEQVNEPAPFLKECFDKDSISCVQMTVRRYLIIIFFFNYLFYTFYSHGFTHFPCEFLFIYGKKCFCKIFFVFK